MLRFNARYQGYSIMRRIHEVDVVVCVGFGRVWTGLGFSVLVSVEKAP